MREGGPSGSPVTRQIAGLRLHQIVVARPGLALTVAAVGREMRADDPGVDLAELRVGESELLRLVAAQVVEGRIRRAHEPVQNLFCPRVLEVERDALLVAVEGLEEVAVAVGEEMRTDRAADIAALGRVLDLDHLGAEVAQHHAAERPGSVLFDGNDAQAGEREHGQREAALELECAGTAWHLGPAKPTLIGEARTPGGQDRHEQASRQDRSHHRRRTRARRRHRPPLRRGRRAGHRQRPQSRAGPRHRQGLGRPRRGRRRGGFGLGSGHVRGGQETDATARHPRQQRRHQRPGRPQRCGPDHRAAPEAGRGDRPRRTGRDLPRRHRQHHGRGLAPHARRARRRHFLLHPRSAEDHEPADVRLASSTWRA